MNAKNDRLMLIDTLLQSISQHILQAVIVRNEDDFRDAIASALEAHAEALRPHPHKPIGFIRGGVR